MRFVNTDHNDQFNVQLFPMFYKSNPCNYQTQLLMDALIIIAIIGNWSVVNGLEQVQFSDQIFCFLMKYKSTTDKPYNFQMCCYKLQNIF